MLLAVAAFAVVVLSAAPAMGAGDSPAKGASGLACTPPSSATPSSSRMSRQELIDTSKLFKFTEWFGGKAASAAAEGVAVMGFHFLSKVTGLEKVLPETQDAKILKQLDGIRTQLTDISGQLNRVDQNVGRLIARVDQNELSSQLKGLCRVANEQQAAFRWYTLTIRAASELGDILEGPHPELADVSPHPGEITPRQRVEQRKNDFLNYYFNNGLEPGISDFREALIPGSAQNSVLEAYGRVLMKKRFLSRDDSEALLAVYSELENFWGLASWMAAEFWAGKSEESESVRVLREYVNDVRRAEASMPPKIPTGAVVDFGEPSDDTTDWAPGRRPIWFAPSAKDVGWLPKNILGPQFQPIAVNEVDEELRALNDKKNFGEGWRAPSMAEFTALISKDCIANADEPKKYADAKACKNVVGPKRVATSPAT